MKRSNLIIGILFIVSSLFRLFSTKSNSFLSSLDWLSTFLKERKFNLFGFVPNSIKKKKKEKFNPTIVEFISNFSFVFNLPFLHIRKTFYPEFFKLTKSQLPFFVFEKKFFIFLRHHPTQIVPPLSNLVWTSLSLSLTFPFLSQIDFHFSLSLWCNRSTIIRYPRKKKKRIGKPTMIKDRAAIRQSELSQNIIGSRSIDFTVGEYLSRDSKRQTIVLCFAHVQIEFPLNSTYNNRF